MKKHQKSGIHIIVVCLALTAGSAFATAPKSEPRIRVTETKSGNRVVFRLDKGTLTLDDLYQVPCPPVYSKEKHLYLLAHDEKLICYSAHTGRALWQRPLDYFFNPGALVLTPTTVTYDVGPMSIGFPQSKADIADWKKTERHAYRIITRTLVHGRTVWNRPWTDVGAPVTAFDDNTLMDTFMKRTYTVEGIANNQVRNYLDLRAVQTGDLIRRWRLPRWIVRKDEYGQSDFATLLRFKQCTWSRGAGKGTFIVAEDANMYSGEIVAPKLRLHGRLLFHKDGRLTIRCLRPIRRRITLTPLRMNGR